jgi:hypothetical protein
MEGVVLLTENRLRRLQRISIKLPIFEQQNSNTPIDSFFFIFFHQLELWIPLSHRHSIIALPPSMANFITISINLSMATQASLPLFLSMDSLMCLLHFIRFADDSFGTAGATRFPFS